MDCGHELSADALHQLFQTAIQEMALTLGIRPERPTYDLPSLRRIKEQSGGLAQPVYRCSICLKQISAPPVECRSYSGLLATLSEVDGLMTVSPDAHELDLDWSDYFLLVKD